MNILATDFSGDETDLAAELQACGQKLYDAWRERDRYRETLLAVRSMVGADAQDYIDRRLEAISGDQRESP